MKLNTPTLEERLLVRKRPLGSPYMLQSWKALSFLHIVVEPSIVQSLLPAGLSVDVFPDETGKEMAWVGLFCFKMENVRFPWMPSIPYFSHFPETNARTYVHRNGKDPAVWFLSLEASRWIACQVARASFGLPYWHSRMQIKQAPRSIQYQSTRLDGPRPARCDLTFESDNDLQPNPEPGSLEFFLLERYILYSVKAGRLCMARVWHKPYSWHKSHIVAGTESVLERAGVPTSPVMHVGFSPGVDVEVFKLEPVS